jgi:hypothetical protein
MSVAVPQGYREKTNRWFNRENTSTYRVSTKELYTFKMIQKANAAYLELHTYTSRQKNTRSFVSNDPGDCCCWAPAPDATSFENGYPTTEKLVCSAVRE